MTSWATVGGSLPDVQDAAHSTASSSTEAAEAGPSTLRPSHFASSSISFGLDAPSHPAPASPGASLWGSAESQAAAMEGWGSGRTRKPAGIGLGAGFGMRGGGIMRKQSLLASEMMMPGGDESQPDSHDEAEGDETMAGPEHDQTVTGPSSFLQRPAPPFRSVSASSSASSLRASNAFSHYTTNPESFSLDRTNSFGIPDDSPSTRSASSSPFSIPAPASGSPSPWSSTPHLPRPEIPRRAASFSARPQSNSGLSNSWAPDRQRTPPLSDDLTIPISGPGRTRMRSGSGSQSGQSHSHSPSPFLHGSNSSPNSNKGSSGGQLPTLRHLRRRSSQPALSGFREFRQSLPPPNSTDTPSLPDLTMAAAPPISHGRRRTSSMNSVFGGRAAMQELDDDVEFAQDTLDAFAMDGVSRFDGLAGTSAGMQRTASDSSGMISDASNGGRGGAMAMDAERSDRIRRRSMSTYQEGEGRPGVAKMVRRKPINRADLLVRPVLSLARSSAHLGLLQPRPKAHLRVAAQLSTEDVSPDLLSEAEVHRRLRSGPSAVPCPPKAPGTPTSSLFPPTGAQTGSSGSEGRPYSSHGRPNPTPTPNRFPEQAVNEDEGMEDQDSSGSDGDLDAASVGAPANGPGGSTFGGAVDDGGFSWIGNDGPGSDVEGSGKEEEDAAGRRAKWTQFRGGNAGPTGVFVGSPGSERGFYRPEMDQDFSAMMASPSGGQPLALRPGKRKSASRLVVPSSASF